jgi:small subunit ribosomal protein S4
MSRYLGPKLRITRKLGTLPGFTQKISKKKSRPGQHGGSEGGNKKKLTEYGIRLEEKQKLKYNYGLTESQLYQYIKEARRRTGVTGLILLQLLEMRLDTICFNLGFGSTIGQTRQLVNHGHITVNNEVVDIASFQCRIGDIIGVKENQTSKKLVDENLKITQRPELPSHLIFNKDKMEGEITNHCAREDLLLELNELLVIEYYSRR